MIRDNSSTSQRVALDSGQDSDSVRKKQVRIELRSIRDAVPLLTVDGGSISREEQSAAADDLQRVNAYCTAEELRISELYKHMLRDEHIKKATLYYLECLYVRYRDRDTEHDLFFFDYGVSIFWGLDQYQEKMLLKSISAFERNGYEKSRVEADSFKYGIVKEKPMVINDVIYLVSDDFFNKMVISCAIAQSVKLDFYEDIVECAIDGVRDLPEEVEHSGNVKRSRKDIMKLMGKLHKLKLNVNLVSNILGEPDILWHYPLYSNLYETFRRYLDIKVRADILNQRLDVIQDILHLLSENMSTRSGEKLERALVACFVILIAILIVFETFTILRSLLS